MGNTTCAPFGGLGLKIIDDRFHGFRAQNPGGGSNEERTTRGQGVRIEAKLSVRWPLDEDYLG